MTISNYGLTWDEANYMIAGDFYAQWLGSLSLDNIDQYWSINHEHPPLQKILGGISTKLFHDKLHLCDRITSFRLPNGIFVFILTSTLYSFVSGVWGRSIAILSTLSFFFLPRVFFHSHIGALDYSMTTMWFLVAYTYWKSIRDQRWIIPATVMLGLSVLTKTNALFIYIPIIFYGVLSCRRPVKQTDGSEDRPYLNLRSQLLSKLRFGFAIYKKGGHLDKRVRFGNNANSDYLILLIRQGFFNEEMWDYYRNGKPVFSVQLNGTDLANVYKLK